MGEPAWMPWAAFVTVSAASLAVFLPLGRLSGGTTVTALVAVAWRACSEQTAWCECLADPEPDYFKQLPSTPGNLDDTNTENENRHEDDNDNDSDAASDSEFYDVELPRHHMRVRLDLNPEIIPQPACPSPQSSESDEATVTSHTDMYECDTFAKNANEPDGDDTGSQQQRNHHHQHQYRIPLPFRFGDGLAPGSPGSPGSRGKRRKFAYKVLRKFSQFRAHYRRVSRRRRQKAI